MKRICITLLLLTIFVYSRINIPIGGSLDFNSHILDIFKNKTVAFITAAGVNPQSDARQMQSNFDRRKIKAWWVPVYYPCKDKVNKAENVKLIKDADAIFFSGGYSGRLQECLFGDAQQGTSQVLEAIQEKEIVSGSSAGAMVQPHRDILITGQSTDSYYAVRDQKVYYRPNAFKIFNKGLVDVHFSERGRQGRLFVLAWQTKAKWAFGIDENTAIYETPDGILTVVGQNGVVVYENVESLEKGTMHYLTQGDSIDATGQIHFPEWKKPCSSTRKPESSRNIFTQFKARSLEVALYNSTEVYRGHVGTNPVVEVTMQKSAITRTVCGEWNGRKYTSFTNMIVGMGRKTAKELGFSAMPNINLEPYYIDY